MAERKRADEVGVGENFKTYKFRVTSEFNQQYLEAMEDYHPWYLRETEDGLPIVHPGLLINHSNVTRSPSFYLPPGIAAVHVKEEIEYLSPGRVGETFQVYWKVVNMYQKLGMLFQVKETLIVDEDGVEILRREITDTYIAGKD